MVGKQRSAGNMEQIMAFYEHIVIARPDMSNTQVDAMVDELKDIITKDGGKVAGTEYWGLKNTAYKIKKHRKAHYVMFNLDTPYPPLAELERQERLNEDILRFMTIKVEELSDEPSVMMKKHEKRERRDQGGNDE